MHQSAHFGATNSKALEIAGITRDTPGGVIRRGPDGEPDGVLEETAHAPVLLKLLSRVGPEGAKAMARAGAALWARYGYTTAQEGGALPVIAEVLKQVAAEGGFATAWRDRPYFDPVGNCPPGYGSATQEMVVDALEWGYATGVRIITHANGERASDLLIAGHRAAQARRPVGDLRPVLIHGQFLREDQVAAYADLGVTPSLFPMHTFYWGDWHRGHTVGPVLADDISPTGWMTARGMRFSTHHDAAVAFPDPMRVLDATVTRRSRSGDILGPAHRVDVITALKAMTIWPAWHHHEYRAKGSIEPGKLADLVILAADPTAVDPETLDTLRVVETIEEGATVFALTDAEMKRGDLMIAPGGPAERSFAATMRAIAVARDFGATPSGPARRAMRRLAQARPHDAPMTPP